MTASNNQSEEIRVKARQRYGRLIAAVLVGITLQGVISPLEAQQQTLQRGQTPGPRFMVPVFRTSGGAERGLGAQVADALRERMGGDFMMRTLWIIPKSDIDNALEQSGYSKTEPLNSNDAKQLANLIRAEEYVEGTLNKTAAGFEFDGALLLVRGDGMVQPLPKVTGAKIGDIAKGVAGAIEGARKPLDDVKKCTTNWRLNKYAEAAKDARSGMQDYPNSVMSRVCLLELANSQKQGPDSIIKYSEDILKLHSQNRRALALVADAYGEKKMDEQQIRALTTLLALDPTNARLTETVVNIIAASGKPEVARPIIDEAVKQNPGDPSLIRLQWRIYLALKEYKQAVTIGEEMIKTDTAAADTNFFTRIVAAYSADSNYAKGAEWAARGTSKFPQNANLWMLNAQLARQAGQAPQALEAVKKALAINPKTDRANVMVAQIYMELNQPDSVIAALQRAEAAGDDKALIGGMALTVGNRMRTTFSQSKKVEDAQAALKVLAYSDKVNPTDNAKFLQGIINLTMGQQLLTEASAEKSCDKAKAANEAFTNAQIQIPPGGKAFPDQARAAMEGLTQLAPYGDKAQKALCK